MKSQAAAILRRNRAIRAALWILGTIFLGALGSGLWELMLRAAVTALGEFTLSLAATLWEGYVDVLHRGIGKLHSDTLSVPSFAVVMSILLVAPWFMLTSLLRRITRLKDKINSKTEEPNRSVETIETEIDRLRKRTFRILVPLLLASTVMYALIAWQLTYTREAGNWADRSIEILRPKLSVEQHLVLRSQLRTVNNASEFYQLESDLRSLASRLGTTLPDFTAIRRFGAT